MAKRLILLLLNICIFASTGWTITFDNATTTARTSLESVTTFSHTTASQNDRVLIVGCSASQASSAFTLDSVTYNSVSMTSVTSVGDSTGDSSYLAVYILAAPATGAHNVVATYSGTVDGYQACFAATWYDVEQMTMNRTPVSRTSGNTLETSTSLSPTTSSASDIVVDFVSWADTDQGTVTAGMDQTNHITIDGAVPAFARGSSKAGTGGTTTMSWSWTKSGWTPDSHIAFALIPVSGPPAGFPLKDIFSPIVVD